MRIVLLPLALFLFAAFTLADSMNTQVICGSTGVANVTGSNTSSVTGPDGTARDALYLTTTYPTTTSGYFTVNLTEDGLAHSTLVNYAAGGGDVLSSASLDLTLNTSGPLRAGYLEPLLTGNAGAGFALAQLRFSIGGNEYQGGCDGKRLNGGCNAGPMPANNPTQPFLYNFTLGTPFQLQLSYTDDLDSGLEESTAQVDESFTLQFRFLESDGITPVAISPEPCTLSLTALALVSVSILGLRRLRCLTDH